MVERDALGGELLLPVRFKEAFRGSCNWRAGTTESGSRSPSSNQKLARWAHYRTTCENFLNV